MNYQNIPSLYLLNYQNLELSWLDFVVEWSSRSRRKNKSQVILGKWTDMCLPSTESKFYIFYGLIILRLHSTVTITVSNNAFKCLGFPGVWAEFEWEGISCRNEEKALKCTSRNKPYSSVTSFVRTEGSIWT